MGAQAIAVPHLNEIKHSGPCGHVYQAYVGCFDFARWSHMKPEAVLVPLHSADRSALEALARRQALGGSRLQDGDMESLGTSLLASLDEAIQRVGGKAFAKTAEKSAKNDVALHPHETALSVVRELTASQDVLQQSLGRGGTGHRQTARYLVVQPWDARVNASNEFRLLIQNGHVVGITQQQWCRDVGLTEESVLAMVNSLLELWYRKLLPLSPFSDCTLDAFVADGEAHLIEVNPCGVWASSGGGLFHWIYDRALLSHDGPLIVRIVVAARGTSTLDAYEGILGDIANADGEE